ncbi:iron transporter, partial [Pseudomonas sp. HMWF005]
VSTLGAYLIYLLVALVMFFLPAAPSGTQSAGKSSSVSSQ